MGKPANLAWISADHQSENEGVSRQEGSLVVGPMLETRSSCS